MGGGVELRSEAEHQPVAANKIGDEALVPPRRALEVVEANSERSSCCSFGHSRQVLGGKRPVGRASQAGPLPPLPRGGTPFGRAPRPSRAWCPRAPGARSKACWRPARASGDRGSALPVSALSRRLHGRPARSRSPPSLWGRCDRLGVVPAGARGPAQSADSRSGGRHGPPRSR